RGQLAEVVARPAGARVQVDREGVVAGSAALRAGGVLAVEEGRRLRLGDRVAARPQVREAVRAAGVGGRGQADGVAEVVGAGECYGDAADRGLARVFGAVVVGVRVDRAAQAGRGQLAEAVARAVHAPEEADVSDLVAA